MDLPAELIDNIAAIPAPPEGHDRFITVLVIDRPDPAGEDTGEALTATGQAVITALADGFGTTPDKIRMATHLDNVELDSWTGPVLTGDEVLAGGV